MAKNCDCGSEMEITLRTLFYNKNLKIKNVPVFSCDSCGHHEVMGPAKAKIKSILKDTDFMKEKGTLFFDSYCELAQLLMIAFNEQDHPLKENSIQTEIEELLESINRKDTSNGMYLKEQIHKKIEKLVH